jgi:hypothetical protein
MDHGIMPTPNGLVPTMTVATTVLVAVSITEAVQGPNKQEAEFATYACFPSGVMAIPTGRLPTVTVATTVLLAVSITEKVLTVLVVT